VTHLVPLEGTTSLSLQLPEGLPYDQWRDTLLMYAKVGKAMQFWLGDALLYGENRFGEQFAQAASETGYSEESLRGFLWVASRVPPSIRRLTLSWSHHQVAAGSEDPKTWLDTAEANSWTVKDLRHAIKPPVPKAVCGMVDCPMRPEAQKNSPEILEPE
jgi:hypothetical protein